MITVGFSTRKDNPNFINYIKETIGIKDIQVIQKINNGEKSLSKVYNEILEESINDIVILCHDDILFEKNYWGKRIIEHFEKNSDYGILGVAGTTFFPKSSRWWDISGEMVGQVYHQNNGKKWLSEYNKPFGKRIIETVIVDGLFISINKKRIKKTFNESFNGFHFYDVSFCLDNFFEGVKIGTISNIEICHLSIGMTNDEWEKNREKLSLSLNDKLPIKVSSNLPINKIDNKLPLVSIITPIYNYGKRFQKMLESVFESTYQNFEIVVVNDGSTDEYVIEKLKEIEKHPNIKVLHQENSGPSVARNNGIKISKGEFILPLDADDTINPEYIKTCINIIKKDKKISPVYCDTIYSGQINGVERRPEWSMEKLMQSPFIVNCSMFHREAFEICGGYDETLYGWEDYDLWIRMGLNGYVGKRIPKPLFNYFRHENDGTVSTEANKNQKELRDKIFSKNFKNEIIDKVPY